MELQGTQYQDCYVRLEQGKLVLGNSALERVWDLTGALPVGTALINKHTGKQWLAAEECGEWLTTPDTKPAFYRRGITEGAMQLLGAAAETEDDCGIGLPCLCVRITLGFAAHRVEWGHRIYPGLPVLRSALRVTVADGAMPGTAENPTQMNSRPAEWPNDTLDCLPLAPEHCRWECVTFHDQTYDRDDLVERAGGLLTKRETKHLVGNLFFAEDYYTHEGLLLVKEGPTPEGTLPGLPADFTTVGRNLYPCGWGFSAGEADSDALQSYGSAIVLWQGKKSNAYAELHRYGRAIRRFVPERDAQIMCNTWGSGNADGRICEEFLMNELRRAKELGISYYQIDDGWETGVTMNSVHAEEGGGTWNGGYYKDDPDFWTVNKQRLPHGLTPLTDYAKANGIMLGLWFSPDSEDDFANWQRDSEVLLRLYHEHGIRAFKMDGLNFRCKRGEENFGKLMRRVITESGGEIFFNLDTTAGVRNGYFGRVQYGTLFLENRFTNNFGSWPNYWPHHTLRNLWQLSRYLPTERLQVEFLNVASNAALYHGDPLSPEACGQGYAFALTLFASPLAWMELTALSPTAADTLQAMIAAYRPVQAEILAGFIQPIGEEPDGTQWTGFLSAQNLGQNDIQHESQNATQTAGYLLLLRGKNDEATHTYHLPGVPAGKLHLTPVLGSGKEADVEVNAAGEASFALPHEFDYALYHYELS